MMNPTLRKTLRDTLTEDLDQLLSELGVGKMNSVAYDTAWIARLAVRYPGQGFDEAIDWLRANQKSDGSWGSEIVHYHDRFISTLSAAVALKTVNDSADIARIQKAEHALWNTYVRLHQDRHDTIAFPVLAVALIEQAVALGLDVPRDLYCDVTAIGKKLRLIGDDSRQWRHNTMSFSLEAVRPHYPAVLDFLENNGSVGASPSATAAMLIQSQYEHPESLRFVQNQVAGQGDGGAPDAAPIDTVNTSWPLNFLRIAGVLDKNHPEVRRLGDFLHTHWQPQSGLGFSTLHSVTSLDDTSAGFSVLSYLGYDVSLDTFAFYEEDTYFRCFHHEANPSLNAILGMLAAIRTRPNDPRYETWSRKLMNTVQRSNASSEFYFDKWHSSPYYMSVNAVVALCGFNTPLIKPMVRWLQRSQRKDGGWGYYDRSTIEETGYALLALMYWQKHVGSVDMTVLDAGARYLLQHKDSQPLIPLWIGKGLFAPTLVARTAILAALHAYADYKDLL
ncbi:hypothetical protein HC776_00440 [bacterium]|nr:hypothetical protein [bacterium]